jgi:hypothetical protein
MSALLSTFASQVHGHGGRVLTHDANAYKGVQRFHAERRNDAAALLAGRAVNGERLDAIPANQRMDSAGKAISPNTLAMSRATVHAWAKSIGEMINWTDGKGDRVRMDALVPVASQALTYFYNEVMEIVHNGLPAWEELILPINRKVPSAAENYVSYERDLQGVARVASTYAVPSIPMVAGPSAQVGITGRIIPFLVGMETNFREAIQAAFARANGKPDFQIEKGKTDGCQRAIAEAINFLWLYGDATMGINGLMNHPAISTLTITGTWASKTTSQIQDDLTAMINVIPNNTAGQLGDRARIKITLPPAAWQRANNLYVTAAGSVTILESFEKRYPGLKIVEEQSFASANSQIYTGGPLGLTRDRALIYYDQKDATRDPSFVLSQDIEMPAPPRQNGLSETVIFHARAGGCDVPDSRGIMFAEGL